MTSRQEEQQQEPGPSGVSLEEVLALQPCAKDDGKNRDRGGGYLQSLIITIFLV